MTAAAPSHLEGVRALFVDPLTRTQRHQLAGAARRILQAMGAPCPASWPVSDAARTGPG